MSTKYKATLDGPPTQITDQQSLLVRIWDLGPTEPAIPSRPAKPTAKEGTPEHDLEMIDFRGEVALYETALHAYAREKKDFAEWHRVYGGPYETEMYSVNAREAIQIEPDRYVAELPKGRKPGRWHQEQQKREADQRRSFAQTVARDPVFGSQGAPS